MSGKTLKQSNKQTKNLLMMTAMVIIIKVYYKSDRNFNESTDRIIRLLNSRWWWQLYAIYMLPEVTLGSEIGGI